MKGSLLLFICLFLINACTQADKNSEVADANPKDFAQKIEQPLVLTLEQESAFDALNTLQVSTDERNRLYSTFAGTTQPCYPPDTSLSISQENLRIAMQQFVNKHCKSLKAEKRDELVAASILAQEKYTLSLCLLNSFNGSYDKGPPMKGTWILPNVLGRRDVVMVW